MRSSRIVVDGYFANFLAKCIDVLLQGDVLEEGVLEDSLQLLVDLETEFQSHPRVGHLAVVHARHDPLARSNLSLKHQHSVGSENFTFLKEDKNFTTN